MATNLSTAQVNHLRRLLGWVRCEVWQSPEEWVDNIRNTARALGEPEISDEAKQRLVEYYHKSASVPKYVRSAIKALEPAVREMEGQITDAEFSKRVAISVDALRSGPQD